MGLLTNYLHPIFFQKIIIMRPFASFFLAKDAGSSMEWKLLRSGLVRKRGGILTTIYAAMHGLLGESVDVLRCTTTEPVSTNRWELESRRRASNTTDTPTTNLSR